LYKWNGDERSECRVHTEHIGFMGTMVTRHACLVCTKLLSSTYEDANYRVYRLTTVYRVRLEFTD